MIKLPLIFLIAVSLAAGVFAAESTSTKPPASAAPMDVSAAVARGVEFFRAQATPQPGTNESGWLFHPLPGNFAQVVGWKTNSVHFKIVEITIPGYSYEDPYEVLVPGPSPTDPLVKQIRYRTIRHDPSKDRKESREVHDPKGPIVHEIPYPIWDKDYGDRWPYGGIGNNGLAILALKRCGVKFEDPLLNQTAYNLARLINSFGYPDATHDLAWLTAGFAVMPGDDFKRLTEQCAAKLLDGQLTTGPAAGLWGPVCVNTAMGSALIKTLGKWGEERKALHKELLEEQAKKVKGKQTTRAQRLEDDLAKLDARLTDLQENSSRIAQLGLLLFDIFGHVQHGMDNWGRRVLQYQGERFGIENLPYVIQNQMSTDLQSTSLALFALRSAYENGRLPMKTWRPEGTKVITGPGAPPPAPPSDFPPPREARDVIALAAKALTTARPADGQWPELNIHQRVTDYVWLKSIPQVISNEFPKLPQPVTLASVCQGAAALANIQFMQTGKAGATALENAACRSMIQELTATKYVPTNIAVRLPYDALLQLTAPRTKAGKTLRTDFTTWNQLADWVLLQQNASGEWGGEKGKVLMPSTSLFALRTVLKDIKDADIVKMYDKPHLTPAFFHPGNKYRYSASEAAYFTAAALLYLSDGIPVTLAPEKPVAKP